MDKLGTQAAPHTAVPAAPAFESRFLDLVARAAPFPERVAGEYFEPVRGRRRREVADRATRWLASAVGDDERASRALLQHRQRTDRDLGAGLLDVTVRDPARLPGWAYPLAEFLDAQPPTAALDPARGMVGAPFVSFRRAADALLPWGSTESGDGDLRGVAVTPRAREEINGQLVQRLTSVCAAAFRFELLIAGHTGADADWIASDAFDVSRAGWLDRLESLPGLAYVLGLACEQWRHAVGEQFDRLYEDLPLLRRQLWDWADPGALASYSGDSGDLHDDGRAVCLLGFDSGRRVVYKPKDLTVGAGFMDLVTFLNHHGLPLDLHTRQVLPRDGYAWEEFVSGSSSVDSADAARRYYRRHGMLVRLMQLLEGRDLWADNLLAIGESPAFIDLETLLQGRPQTFTVAGPAYEPLWQRLEETVVRTATVSYPHPIGAGRRAQDIGCLAPLQEQLAEDLGAFPAEWTCPAYRPTVDGRLADPRDYADEVVAGYVAMQECLRANRVALADPRGPLYRLRGATVRYIWRNTWDCNALLRASLSPLALHDGVAREVVLARAFRSVREMLRTGDARPDVLEIVEREIDALRRLDVPFFLSRTDSDAAFTPDRSQVPGHFAGTAWDRLQVRIDGLETFPLDEQVAYLQGCLDLARRGEATHRVPADDADGAVVPVRRHGVAVYHPDRLAPTVSIEEAVARAREIADAVIAAAVPLDGDRRGWLGYNHYPPYGMSTIEPLGGDLLCGTAGLGVFFTELYQNTGSPVYWAAAQDALRHVDDFSSVAHQSATYRWVSGSVEPVGGFLGLGGAVYALARCGAALGEARLVARAGEFADLALAAVVRGRTGLETVTGRAGLLLGLHALLAVAPTDGLRDAVEALHDRLLADLATATAVACSPYPPGEPLLAGLPTGRVGVRYALALSAAKLGRVGTDAALGDVAATGAAAVGAAVDLGAGLGAADADAATPGHLLAELGIAHHCGRPVPPALEGAVLRYLADTRARTCQELVVAADLATYAATVSTVVGQADAAATFTRDAARAACALLARRERTGRWFGDRLMPDRLNLSATGGLAAAGLTLLRLADEDVSALRMLA